MLTDLALKAIKPKEKTYKLADGKGLYIEVTPTGSIYWRMKYRYAGKEKRISLGVYPEVSLKNARTALSKAREQLANGIDPSALRKVQKAALIIAADNSFQAVGEEWFTRQKPRWAEKHWVKVQWMLEKNLYPWLGQRPIADITAPELLAVLRRIENRGAVETAKRTKQVSGQVFRFAIATGRTERDPSQYLKDALATSVKKHLAAITEPEEVGPLLRALDAYHGTPIIRAALQMAPLTFVRPGELRNAQWSEINFDTAEWRIPAERMKGRLSHIVPLSKQSLEVLRELHPITGHGIYLFPSPRSPRRPMSDNAVLAAMRRMGIAKEEMCGHGFRAMARTILDEVLNYRVDWIEHQLAHAVRDANGRAYNRTSHLEGRRKMMQGWADYLDTLRSPASGSNVVTIQQHVEAKQ
jgi:integrase